MFNRTFWLAWYTGALTLADMRNPDSIVNHIFWAAVLALVVSILSSGLKAAKKIKTEEEASVPKPRRATREDVR